MKGRDEAVTQLALLGPLIELAVHWKVVRVLNFRSSLQSLNLEPLPSSVDWFPFCVCVYTCFLDWEERGNRAGQVWSSSRGG